MMKNTLKTALAALCLAGGLQADNFLAPTDDSAKAVDSNIPQESVPVPTEPLPPIEPIFSSSSAPAQEPAGTPNENDRVMTVQKIEFWVQMGAFQNAEGAKVLETKLKAHGLNAKLFSTDLHRVAVGPYASRDQAGRSLETLRAIEKEAFLTTPDRLLR